MTNHIAISDARANLPNLVADINEKLDRAIITVNGQPKAVLLSVEELESLEETLEVAAIPGIKKKIKESIAQIDRGEYVTLDELLKKKKKKA